MLVVLYEGDVLFFGDEASFDLFISEHPWYSDFVEVLTLDEYLSL